MSEQEDEIRRILLAEDDRDFREILTICLRQEGHTVVECADGFHLLEHLDRYLRPEHSDELGAGTFDLIISDVRLPIVSGLDVLEALSRSGASPPMIIMTAFPDEHTRKRAKCLDAAGFLDKPFELQDLVATVRGVFLRRGPGPDQCT